MEIGTRLKNARVEMGLTQEKVAEDIGVSRQTVSNWENGRCYPDIVNVIKLSDLYSVSLDELLKEDKKMIKHLKEATDALDNRQKYTRLILKLCYWGLWVLGIALWWTLYLAGALPGPTAFRPYSIVEDLVRAAHIVIYPWIIAVIMGFMGAVNAFDWRKWLYVPVTGAMFMIYCIVTKEWLWYFWNMDIVWDITGEKPTPNLFEPFKYYFIEYNLRSGIGEWFEKWVVVLLIGAGCSAVGLFVGTFIRYARYYFRSRKENRTKNIPERQTALNISEK